MANPGDRVQIESEKGVFEGMLMPEEKGKTILKLDTGYNVGFIKKDVKLKLLDKKKDKKEIEEKKISEIKGLPEITILHTGGTIASKVDYETGGVIARFTPEELIAMFPEIKNIANMNSRLVRNMWSEDIRFAHYNILAKEIEKEVKKGVDGVIITHGTDSLHYTGAALSFALQNLSIPVILVGAQRSSDRGSSDAAVNIISAVNFIAKTDYSGVALCMHENTSDDTCLILQGTKCRKMHSSARNSFKPINTLPIARINFGDGKTQFLKNYVKKAERKLEIKLFNEKIKVAMLKIHTNMFAEQFLFYEKYDGLLIEGFGIAGNVPINEIDEYTKEHTKISKAIKKLIDSGVVVATSTQTINGAINMNVYSTGRKMQELGIIGNYCDMHPETAFIKLAWLLSNYKKQQVKELFEKNLVGEISERLGEESTLE